jgi:hypothetical protein
MQRNLRHAEAQILLLPLVDLPRIEKASRQRLDPVPHAERSERSRGFTPTARAMPVNVSPGLTGYVAAAYEEALAILAESSPCDLHLTAWPRATSQCRES